MQIMGPVPAGTKVKGNWSGALDGSVEGATDLNGEVTFQLVKVRNGGTFIFTIMENRNIGNDSR
jgi:hypothetical protein